MTKILKKSVLFVLAVLVVFGTYFLEYKIFSVQTNILGFDMIAVTKAGDALLNFEDSRYEANSGSEIMVLNLGDNVVFRLNKDTRAVFSKQENGVLKIQLAAGQLWVNNFNSALPVEVHTAQIVLRAEPGVFDFEYTAPSLIFKAFRHSLFADFLGKRLILPEGREMSISESKLAGSADTISKLRYSKLAKEFPYFSAETRDVWSMQNLSEDEKFAQAYRQSVENDIRKRGSVIPFNENSALFKLDDFLNDAYVVLTFDPAKKSERAANVALDYFDAASYADLIGKNEVAQHRFLLFANAIQSILNSGVDIVRVREILNAKLDKFTYVQPDDVLFEAKNILRETMRLPVLVALHNSFNDILDVYSNSFNAESQQKISNMLRRFATQAASVRNINESASADDIFYESMLLNDFFNRSPKLLKEEFLQTSELFEQAYLRLLASKEEQEDQKQFLIGEKLRRIKAVIAFLNNNTMPFQDARNSILMLVRQIENLKPTFPTSAVLTYFEDQLAQLGNLLSFLRSTSANNVHGSFQEDFAEFQTSMDEMRAINELLSGSTGGMQISPFRREELASVVVNDLAVVGVSDVKIVLPEEEGDARVRISESKFEGKNLAAVYDTVRKVFSEINFDNEQISNAIRLENLRTFLSVKSGRTALPRGTTPESLTEAPSQQSLLERVAKATFMEELENNNIIVEEPYLGFENFSEGIIHVRMAHIGQGADAKVFSFDIEQRANIVRNLKVQTVSGEIPVNDSFILRDLPIKVTQIYQRALFEKQREEELARFAREGTVNE